MVAITVGVACYNVEAWVEECLVSLFGQTFTDFEIIAVDDGSTDQTGKLLDSLAARDDRLRVVHQENAGLGRVKNRILKEARGRFVAFVDGDDWLASECLAEAHRCAVEDDLDVVAFGWVRIKDGTDRILARRNDHQKRNVKDVEDMRKAVFSAHMNLMSCASLVRTSLFIENNLDFPYVGHEDIHVTPFLYFYGKRFGYVDRDLYYWRVRERAITQTLTISRIDGLTSVFESWKARLSKEGKFEDYRDTIIVGTLAYMSTARRRIADQGGESVEFLDHFRNRILLMPEIGEYTKYLSALDRKKYANIISIIEQTLSERNERPRMTPALEIPSVGRRLIRIFRNRSVLSFVGRRLASPTAALLAAGLALTGAAHTGPVWIAWLPVPGLALVCFVVMKEAVLWRWQQEQTLARFAAQLAHMKKVLSESLSSERDRFQALLSSERARSERALSESLSSERDRFQALLSSERARSERALSESLSSERDRFQALLSSERARSERALSESLSSERDRFQALLSSERARSERALSEASERALSEALRRSPELYPHIVSANNALRYKLKRMKMDAEEIYDIVCAVQKDYHLTTFFPIAERLRQDGFRVSFLDFSAVHRDEGVQRAGAQVGEKDCHHISDFIAKEGAFKMLVVFNDWDRRTTYPLVLDSRESGVCTVGLIEGINDFEDVDTGLRRNSYRTVEWVLGLSERERKYFPSREDRFRVVGFPRIAEVLRQPYRAPTRRRAVINVSFAYGVLEDKRSEWLASVIEGCRLANIEWVISQHPADEADLSNYPVDSRAFEELIEENAILISRTSACIIEALAKGRAVVYHNPGIERLEVFRESLGAYSCSIDAQSLAESLEFEMKNQGSVVSRRIKFLEKNVDFSLDYRPHEKAVEALKDIYKVHCTAQKDSKTP